MARGKHAKKTNTTKTQKIAAVSTIALGGAASPLLMSGTAQAADMAKWDCIAAAESGTPGVIGSANWNIDHGDADSTGGLQIQTRTWNDFGGQAFAPTAGQASEAQQIQIAEKILASQGPGAWATAGQCSGIGSWSGTPAVDNGGGAVTPPPVAGGGGVGSTDTGMTPHAAAAIAWAKTQLGKPYIWGGTGPDGYDCSGLLMQAWANAGVQLPGRTTYDFWGNMTHVDTGSLRPGDLILWDFGTAAAPDHVTMYIGDGQMIESSGSHGGVVLTQLAGRGGTVMGAVRPEPGVVGTPTPTPTPTPVPVPTPTPTPVPTPTPTPTPTPVPTPTPTPDPGGHGWHHRHHKHCKHDTPAPTPTGKTYTVKSGDWLRKISRTVYGDNGDSWKKIYDANKTVIGSDPNLILPGQVLSIP